MSGAARLVAAADLLSDDRRLGDRRDLAAYAAQQIARLCRCARGVVVIEADGESVRACYPPTVRADLAPELVADAARGPVRIRARAQGPIDGGFDPLDDWLLSTMAARIATQCEIVLLRETAREARTTAHDLQTAADIQRRLMAADGVSCPGLAVAAATRPAASIGGDVVSIVPVPGGVVGIIGDVSGKGVAGSMLTSAVLATATQHVRSFGLHPGETLRATAACLEDVIERSQQLVTLALIAVEAATGEVRVASAGHHLLYVVADDALRAVPVSDPPLGAAVARGREEALWLDNGEAFVAATDGFTDQRDPFGRCRGETGFAGLLSRAARRRVAAMVDAAYEDVDAHASGAAQDDDQSIVAIGRAPDVDHVL